MTLVRAALLMFFLALLGPSLVRAQVPSYYGPPYTTNMVYYDNTGQHYAFFCGTPPLSYGTPGEVVDRWNADALACASNSTKFWIYSIVTPDHTYPPNILSVVGYWTPPSSPNQVWVVAHLYNFKAAKNLGRTCNCAGDPINLGTGNEFRDDVDIGGGELAFHRYYNSHIAASTTHIGFNWRHSFDRALQYFSGGTFPSTAEISRPDGRVVHFDLQGGLWQADSDIADRLTQQTDAVGNFTGWTYFEAASRSLETYDTSGKLLSIADSNGLLTTLAYSTSSTPASIAPKTGLLITVTDPRGRVLDLAYNADSTISALVEPDGSMITYAYDTNGNLSRVAYPDQTSRQYLYNEGTLTQNTNLPHALTGDIDETGARFTSIGYNSNGLATMSMLASNINVTQVNYMGGTTQDNAGYEVLVTYPSGAQSNSYFLITNGNVRTSAVIQPCGPGCGQPNASATFDVNGYPASTTDFNGNVTKSTYDPNGLLNQQIEAYGSTSQRTTNITWDTTLRVPQVRTVLDASGQAVSSTQWIYNTIGQVLARCEIDPANSASAGYSCSTSGTPPAGVRRWSYTYCPSVDGAQCPIAGLLLSATGPRGDANQTTSFSYYLTSSASGCGTPGGACYQAGDLYQVTDALGHTTTYASYDAKGHVTRISDANGVNTDLTYTARDLLATRTIGGATTTFTYTPFGAVSSVKDADGVKMSYTYDAAHRLTDITDALNNRLHYTLDSAGNRTAEQVYDSGNALRRSLSKTYNSLGQLATLTDGLAHVVFAATYNDSYDRNGNLVHSVDALGVQHSRGFDGLNRLVGTTEDFGGSTPSTQNTQNTFTYDANDRLRSVNDPAGLSTVYGFDGLGNATAVQSPDTGNASYSYDAAGNIAQYIDARGVVVTSTYDALDRRASTSYSTSATLGVTYSYDEPNSATGCTASYPIGRLTRIVENAVTTVYCYDARGNITQKRQIQGTATDSSTFNYTLGNRIASAVTPSGTMTQYSRDAAGRVSGVTVLAPGSSGASNVVTSINYLPFGPIASYTLGKGQTVTRTYNANYALTDVASSTFNLHVTRSAMNDVISLGSKAGYTTPVETYSYDALYRLTGIFDSRGSAIETYTYNKASDRTSKTSTGLDAGTYGYQVGTHRLASIGNAARVYDPNGNTAASVRGGTSYGYGYDARNRMTVVQQNGATVATYTYNALGQRVAKSATYPATLNQRYVYDENGLLVGEYGSGKRDYIWLGSLPVAVVDTTGTTSAVNYVITDGSNTPRAITGSTGKSVWSLAYQTNPFGEQLPTSSSGFTYNLRSPGQYYDAESGLNYNITRYYESAAGRYGQSDATGLWGGINTYAAVSNNPLNRIDPDGLRDIFVGGLGDGTSQIVQSYYTVYHAAHPDSAYYSWRDLDDIVNDINSTPSGDPINLIGHSYGGDTAAQAAIRACGKVALLITIDPVSYHGPDPSSLENAVGTWVDVDAEGGSAFRLDNLMAGGGGGWNSSPNGIADLYIQDTTSSHQAFERMMNASGPGTNSPAEILGGASLVNPPFINGK